MVRSLLTLITLWMFLAEYASGSICTQTYSERTSSTQYYTVSCGWWGWSRCRRSRTVYNSEVKTRKECCPGSFGNVTTNECEGVCPYSDAQVSSGCPDNRVCRDYQCDGSGVNNASLPTSAALTFNENDDQEKLLWTADSQCFVQEECACAGDQQAKCTCSKTVPCTHCTVQGTDRIAEVRNGVEIYRKGCQHTCSDCSRYPGCLDHNVIYLISVICQASGYDDNDAIRQILTLNIIEAPKPNITLPAEANVPIVLETDAEVGDTILTLDDIYVPDSEEVTYRLEGPTSSRTGEPLFAYNGTTSAITVNSDLSEEQGGEYSLEFCVVYRRGATCIELSVKIERITTTSTTTTLSPTTRPDDNYICVAEGFWKLLPGMDWWCNVTCGSIQTTCPYLHTHCTCDASATERLHCTAGGWYSHNDYWKTHMDDWCDLNCNAGNYSNCPTDITLPAYCVCN